MRNGLIGLVSTMVLASTMATAGCSSSGGTVGTGGSSSSGGGSSSTGGTGGGSSSTGGTGAGGASAVGSVTNLSGTKVLGELTTAEAAQLCSDAYAYFGRAISRATTCKWKGLVFGISSSAPTDATLEANCASQETSCLQANPASPSCSDFPSPCTATVAEYSTCIADQAAAFSQTVSGLASCATVTRADLAAVWDFSGAAPPASCTPLDITCAGLDLPSPRN